MGILRFLLAVSVVAAHSGPIFGAPFMPGTFAVETFFMISGFYMSLILTDKYVGPGSTWSFYSNRYLRLYPTYFVVLIATWMWILSGHGNQVPWQAAYEKMQSWQQAVFVFSNWTLIGLDIPRLLHFSPDTGFLAFVDATKPAPAGYFWAGDLTTVWQAWSVGLEIWFYLTAPFLVRRNLGWLLVLAAASMGVKVYLKTQGIYSYEFLPAQFVFFIFGMFGHRFWRAYRQTLGQQKHLGWLVVITALLTMFFPWWQLPLQRWIYYVLIACSLPFLFACTRKIGWDRWIGNLSYPIYLVHVLVKDVVVSLGVRDSNGEVILLATLAVATAVLRWLEEPLDAWRQKRIAAAQ
jgi:peptidoglycan/LPS O-acetylase OafA/YrhL